MSRCEVCFRRCEIAEGESGFCGARENRGGRIIDANYGMITSLAMDPVEKKPLARFHPGSTVLSAGSYGCNLACPFCQNHEISKDYDGRHSEYISPETLAATAAAHRNRGCIGVAYTYNEPLVGYEYVRDTAELVHEHGMKNVLVTNGTAAPEILAEIIPFIDAMNIDLKGFSRSYYREVLKGDLDTVKDFISAAVPCCHVELTTLIVPGGNDSEEEMDAMTSWIAELDRNIPLHVTRFFPGYRMRDRAATDVDKVYRLARTARKRLKYVYTGNC